MIFQFLVPGTEEEVDASCKSMSCLFFIIAAKESGQRSPLDSKAHTKSANLSINEDVKGVIIVVRRRAEQEPKLNGLGRTELGNKLTAKLEQ